MKHINITISGRVQGVGFRYQARSVASNLGIRGYVKNTYDNKVYIEAEGDDIRIEEFLIWCHKGPASARIDNVVVIPGELKSYDGFEVRF
jgi:acylphosphatase